MIEFMELVVTALVILAPYLFVGTIVLWESLKSKPQSKEEGE